MKINRRNFLQSSIGLGAFYFPKNFYCDRGRNRLPTTDWVVEVLGTAQDAGVPQFGCRCKNCDYYHRKNIKLYASCIGLYNRKWKKFFIFDATPDIREQLFFAEQHHKLNKLNLPLKYIPDGIFLTHAHIGHYTGLMHYGFESLNSNELKVYCSNEMANYLSENGPWSQLVDYHNISLNIISPGKESIVDPDCKIVPYLVPHRQEYTDTLCYRISGKEKSLIYIPDIDSWEEWDKSIIEVVQETDIVIIDGTFFDYTELPGRDKTKIPHPTIKSSIELLKPVVNSTETQVYFTHLNHSNPLVIYNNRENEYVKNNGFNVAKQGMLFGIG